jgi:DNA-binding NtrC family response regulator
VNLPPVHLPGPADLFSRAMSLKEARELLERRMALDALARNEGKISAAASELGLSRPTFVELLVKLGIPPA